MPKNRKAFLEITNQCNLSCAFCPKTARTPRRLSEAEFCFLAERLRPFADYLYFHLMGEPTAHPLLPAFIAFAGRCGFRPMLTTNGTLLPLRGSALLTEESRPYKVSISLHAFEANPPGMTFSSYLDGCLSFAEAASACGIIIALRLWNLDGRAEGALHEKNEQILAALHRTFSEPWTENRSGFRLAPRVFLEWGEKFDWPEPDGPVLSDTGFCYALRDQIGVLADGTVVPCCLDHNGDLALGNLFETPLEDILSSPRAKAIYDGFTAHRCHEALCRRCMRASYYRD